MTATLTTRAVNVASAAGAGGAASDHERASIQRQQLRATGRGGPRTGGRGAGIAEECRRGVMIFLQGNALLLRLIGDGECCLLKLAAGQNK